MFALAPTRMDPKMRNHNTQPRLLLALVGGVILLCARGQAAAYPAAVNALNPVAYYRLNETDPVPVESVAVNHGSLGAAFDGEYQAMAASRGLPGAIVGDTNTAARVQGALGQQVVVPYAPEYNPGGPFTVEFWARPTAAAAGGGTHTAVNCMVNGENPANGDDRSGWCVRHVGPAWQFVLGFDHSDGSTFYHTILEAAGTVQADAWQHVVAVYAPGVATLYVNGTQAATTTPAQGHLPNTGAPLILGDRGYTGWDFDGLLDEVAVYTTALSAADVQAHYNNALNAARPQPYPELVQEKAPALYFRLGEASLALPTALNTGSWGAGAHGSYLIGTATGIPALQDPAAPGFEASNTAAGFEGGYLTIPAQTALIDEVTLVCWIKPAGPQPARAGILHQRVPGAATGATGLGFQDDGRALSYNWNDQANTYSWNPGFVPPEGVWTFVALSVPLDDAVLYMGTAAGLAAATNIVHHDASHDFSIGPIEIGRDPYDAARVFNGEVDEFAIFDRVLTQAEIQSLYNAALPAILGTTRTPADPVYEGLDVRYTTTVAGPGPITYQWRKDGVNLAGATASSLDLEEVTLSDQGLYSVVATTGGNTLTGPDLPLEVVQSGPVLVGFPQSGVRFINGIAEFRVTAQGSEPLSYTWEHDGAPIAAATGAILVLSDLQPADAGTYTVTVSNPLGSDQASATLSVLSPTKFAAAAVDAGPLAYWRLDEAEGSIAYDYWGGRDGSYPSSIVNGVPGPRPAAFNGFESSNTAYDITGGVVTVPPLNLNKATMTIVTWIKPNGVQPNYAGIVFTRAEGTTSGLDYQQSEQLGYHWNDTADSYNWGSGLYPVTDQWNFVALVVEPTQATMYLDDASGTGLQSNVNVVNHGPSGFNGPLVFGQDPTGGRQYLGGIDEVVIYDRALSSAEITALRNAGVTGAYAPSPVSIVQQPASQTIMAGTAYSLEVRVTGSVPITYQWRKDGQDLPGAIRSSLSFASATEADSGTYQLFITQGATQITSSPATLTVKPVPTHVNLPEDLVLHLKFDGDYQDASGRNNHGTAQGSPQIVGGKIGTGALRYNTVEGGAANYVRLGNPADLRFGGSTSFSVAFWIKFTGAPGDLPFLCNNANSYGDVGFTFAPSWQTGSWSWSLNDGAAPADWPGFAAQYGDEAGYPNVLNDGVWHHLAFLIDRQGDVTTYADGVKVHGKSINGLVFNLDTSFEVNIGQAANGAYSVGGTFEMDDLGIWRKVLTQYDAQAIYLVGQNYGRSFDVEGPAEVRLAVERSGGNLVLSWTEGTLQQADAVNGTYTPVTGASAPSHTVTPGPVNTFYRVRASD
jgi:hypothetical protein